MGLWMHRGPVTISPETSIARAAELCRRHRIRRLPVVVGAEPEVRLVGLVTMTDLARAFPPDLNPSSAATADAGPAGPVSEIMTRVLHTVEVDTPIEDAARTLLEHKIGALPVLQGGRLVGIITESDIFRTFLDLLEQASDAVRVTFELVSGRHDATPAVDLARRLDLEVASLFTFERDRRRMGVVRLRGAAAEEFVEALWASGHKVLHVARR